MLRVLTLATLFPNGARPTFGVFVERQTCALAARDDVAVEVVAPVGLPIWPLSRHPHYASLRDLPLSETWNGLNRPPAALPSLARPWPVRNGAADGGHVVAAAARPSAPASLST